MQESSKFALPVTALNLTLEFVILASIIKFGDDSFKTVKGVGYKFVLLGSDL